jgi:hypothetical protein
MKKTHLSIKYYISVLFFFTLSCGVSKINNSNNSSLDSSNYTTSFLMKDGSILYFVKPIKLNSKGKEINVDFTLINKEDNFGYYSVGNSFDIYKLYNFLSVTNKLKFIFSLFYAK